MPSTRFPIDPDEMKSIESTLRVLQPRPSRLDRDALMFRAGQAAPRVLPRRWLWPMVAAGLALVALGEAAWLAVGSDPRVIERVVVVHEPAPSSADALDSPAISEPSNSEGLAPVVILHRSAPEERRESIADRSWLSESSYLQLRGRVLRFGLDAWPEPPPPLAMKFTVEEPTPSRLWLRSEIEKVLNPGEPS